MSQFILACHISLVMNKISVGPDPDYTISIHQIFQKFWQVLGAKSHIRFCYDQDVSTCFF